MAFLNLNLPLKLALYCIFPELKAVKVEPMSTKNKKKCPAPKKCDPVCSKKYN